MKRVALMLILYTSPMDPGSAIFCDLDSFMYGPPLVANAQQCVVDRVYGNGFDATVAQPTLP